MRLRCRQDLAAEVEMRMADKGIYKVDCGLGSRVLDRGSKAVSQELWGSAVGAVG